MNALTLKTIALLTMIIDHYGAIFQSDFTFYRIIGRLAFPIYCFLLVEGYFHTRNFKKYALRLFLFALISEIPFDLAFYNKIGFYHQNIFFTLFIGLITIYILDKKMEKYQNLKFLVVLAASYLSIFLATDYNALGIIYILAFYYTKKFQKSKRFTTLALVMFGFTFVFSHWLQQYSLLSLAVLYFYNGQLGPKNKVLQISFYAAYPIHLLLFYLIK